MRTLGLHVSSFHYEAREPAIAGAEPLAPEQRRGAIDEPCLVLLTSVEHGDEQEPESVARQLAEDTQQRAKRLGVQRVVLYPYVHLTESPAAPRDALKVLDQVESLLRRALEVSRAPFGWYKAFDLAVLGHPLSEWSGRFQPQSPADHVRPARRGSEFVRWVVFSAEGDSYEISPEDFGGCLLFDRPEPIYDLLRQFVANELGPREDLGRPPKHIEYMRRHELVDYCDASEKGHYKWYPKGLLIQRLLLDYAAQLVREWGAFEVKNPLLIRGDHNVVGELMGEFHERDYKVDGGRGIGYLRYASDPLGFPFLQQVRFGHRQTPLRIYEEATCFRNEQEGEVSGLKRVRGFVMTDMHAACASAEEARQEFEALCLRFARLMDDIIAPGRWVLGWEGTVDFFEANRAWLAGIGLRLRVPQFYKLMPQMSHYYAIKNEYQVITEDRSNVQVSTVQWDVKDGARFDIGYVDAEGKKVPCPVILHASSFGSIERTLCALLEKIAVDAETGIAPQFPLWLSPTQVRVIPISDVYLAQADEICAQLTQVPIRADVDDRDETLGKRIRLGEQEWLPHLVVVGQKELDSGRLSVRTRGSGRQRTLSVSELAAEIRRETEGMPFRPLPLPVRVSRRPLFFG